MGRNGLRTVITKGREGARESAKQVRHRFERIFFLLGMEEAGRQAR